MKRILIVDDEANIRQSLQSALTRRGYDVTTSGSYEEGRRLISTYFDVAFFDIVLGDGSGLDLLKTFKSTKKDLPIVMISGQSDIDTAVKAIHNGAYDFIEKPVTLDRIIVTIENAISASNLQKESVRLTSLAYGDFIGNSSAINKLRSDIQQSAPKAKRFLILGENGTGKEMVANLIHRMSRKSNGPFVAINCAALPPDLIESELFGHIKGAFTGATKNRTGRFIEAHTGSLFLDEISEMTIEAQAKLLRAIETEQVTPVGSDKPVQTDCNIIAATNRDLKKSIEQGRFREDLYYRLNVVQFDLPPLRNRKSDIPLLCQYFLQRIADESGSTAKEMTSDAIKLLKAQLFRGNVRELKNLMERVHIYCNMQQVTAVDLRPLLPPDNITTDSSLKDAVASFEREYIKTRIQQTNGNMSEAARQLGLERSHLYKKVRKLNIESGK